MTPINESTIQKLCLLSPSNIDISLYGCNSESYLAVTGKDLMEAGVPQGPKLGEYLNALDATKIQIKQLLF